MTTTGPSHVIPTSHHGRGRPASLDIGYGLLWLTFALGGFVIIEPAPFDLAFIGLAVLLVLSGLKFSASLTPFICLCVAILFGGLLALTKTGSFGDSFRHLYITAYLMVVAVMVAALVHYRTRRALDAIFGGTVVAALATGFLGIAGYFSLFPGANEHFTLFDRAKGAFKDPNVFGPFLIIAGVYALFRILEGGQKHRVRWFAVLAVVTLAVLLSFSRGAWGHFIISMACCVLLFLMTSPGANASLRAVLISTGCLAVLGTVLLLALNIDAVSQMFLHRGQLVQVYDVGDQGRFDGQLLALQWVLANPMGVGQYDFGAYWGAQPHNVYLYMFLQTGWLGGFTYLGITLAALLGGLKLVVAAGRWRGHAIVLVSIALGLAIEGLVVDTDHWRHFWVIIGALWGLIARQRDDTAPGSRQERRARPGSNRQI